MESSGEQPESPTPVGDAVRLEAHASDQARITQVGRGQHLYFQDGVRGARRVESGTDSGECPYPGLASFVPEQARWFFGRDELTAELISRLDARLHPPHAPGQPLTGHTNSVTEVVFSPDGHTLASSSYDQTVRLWGMNVDQAIQRICATTRNTLTPEKWEQYVSPDLPYHPPCP